MPKGGDLPYLFIALTHRIPLVTEDMRLRRVAERWRELGRDIQVLDIDECIQLLTTPPPPTAKSSE